MVSIYIEAPRAFCVERTIANMGVTPEVANATIERTDKFRADYYKYYTHGNYWTNPVNYDLTLNSELVNLLCDNITDPENQIIGVAHADAYEDSLYVIEQIKKRIKGARCDKYHL